MSSNLTTTNSFQEVLLRKLSYAVTCSVLSHVTIIFIYIFVVNFSPHPAEWLGHIFNTITSFSTWLYLIPFASIIFAQIMICAKDYVLKSTYEVTRFQKFMATFSFQTLILGLLHVAIGGLAVWLYLSVTRGQYQDLYIKCTEKDYCLVEGTLFLIVGGLWTGLYFFVQLCIADKNLIFPVVQQSKLLHFKAKFLPLLKHSKNTAFYPTICYFVLYYVCGSYLRSFCASLFKLRLPNEAFSFWLYFYAWMFAVLYIVNMNLMLFFFELFLTEPIEHPVMAMHDNDASLSKALLLHNMPILQHLACLDLYLLSMWSPQRRQMLFTLSQPGRHPQTWNRMIEGALTLLTEFTETLNKSTDILLNKEEKTPAVSEFEINKSELLIQSPLQRSTHASHMRSMMFPSPMLIEGNVIVEPPHDNLSSNSKLAEVVTEKLAKMAQNFKNLKTIKYVFGELPESHIKHCLKNGQLIVWTTQGLANVAVASFNEDPYGIVQKDLPVLITSLVQLKQSMEKLNKVPEFSRRGPGFDNFSFQMKNSVNAAVKRSLCNICRTFGKYLNDIPLKRDVVVHLQCYL